MKVGDIPWLDQHLHNNYALFQHTKLSYDDTPNPLRKDQISTNHINHNLKQ